MITGPTHHSHSVRKCEGRLGAHVDINMAEWPVYSRTRYVGNSHSVLPVDVAIFLSVHLFSICLTVSAATTELVSLQDEDLL